MNPKPHHWLVWLIPFTLCTGIVLGTLTGLIFLFEPPGQEEAGAVFIGAAGTMVIVLSPLIGFPAGMFTVVISRITGGQTPDSAARPLFLSILGGTIIGGAAAAIPPEHFILTWLLLVIGSALITWFSIGPR
jgi:hypothetical protein